jgi:hypothetical protein
MTHPRPLRSKIDLRAQGIRTGVVPVILPGMDDLAQITLQPLEELTGEALNGFTHLLFPSSVYLTYFD